MTPDEEDLLIEQVASAWRPAPDDGALQYHAAWHDLGEAARVKAFERARALRMAEAALDPEGMSTTARAVLARLSR
ncbi:MAG: hypothetical protein SFX73_35825 [Kofleriaceae bacterium]|nr:hypothetical protein [Kofleriaceae bacterium]